MSTRYNLEQIQLGLTCYALASGNSYLASRELQKLHDLKVDPKTLQRWAQDKHRDEYERLRTTVLQQVGARVAEAHTARSVSSMQLENELDEELLQGKMKELKPKELSDLTSAKRNLATSAGIHTSRARELQGDLATPSQTERSGDEVLRRMEAMGMLVVDGEAEEIPPPELPEGE